MNQFHISGTVKQIGEVYQSGTFQRCNVIIDAKDGNYDEVVELQFTQDRVAIAQSLGTGDKIDCQGVLKGRMGKDGTRAFTNLNVLVCNVAKFKPESDIEFHARVAKNAAAGFEAQDNTLPF